MKNLNLIIASIFLFILGACNSQQSENKQEQVATEEQKPIEETKEVDELANYRSELQGTWKRDSYPYDNIIFKESQIKYDNQEGAVEPPKFEDFELVKTCSVNQEYEKRVGEYDFAISRDKYCDLIKMSKDSFLIYWPGDTNGVKYSRDNSK